VALGRSAGLRYVYVERAQGPAARATRCPGCGETVVERDIWATSAVRLTNGACPGCGRVLEGRW
jgi:pyruvate formate lyase activating enzyme